MPSKLICKILDLALHYKIFITELAQFADPEVAGMGFSEFCTFQP